MSAFDFRLSEPFFPVGVHRRLFAEDGSPDDVVDCGNVLDLWRKGADTLEFTIGWRKAVFLLGHGLRRRNKLAFYNLDPTGRAPGLIVFLSSFACVGACASPKLHRTTIAPKIAVIVFILPPR